MSSSVWKKFALALPLALALSSNAVSWAQSSDPFTDDQISTVADEQLFDTQLLSRQPCVNSLLNPAQPIPGTTYDPTTANPYDPTTGNAAGGMPGAGNSPFGGQSSLGALPAGQGALTAQSNVAAASMNFGGYLDPAAPVTMFRLRYDDALSNRFPDRGEYFYAQCGCFRDPAAGANQNLNAKGPQGLHNGVSYQQIRPYFEYAFNPKFSVFVDLPFQFNNFNSIANPPGFTQANVDTTQGLGDMNAGFKYAFIAEQDRYVTFQLRTYIPTGDSYEGLGTGHYSIEPSILYYRRLSTRWLLQGQLTEWTPISVSGFASQVVQYGGGLGYIMAQGQNYTLIPTVEAVGWTFIGGQKFNPVDGGLQSASGDTIFNIKPGVRIGLGNNPGPMMLQKQSIYAGFGIPVTSDQFYTNLFRLEYRVLF